MWNLKYDTKEASIKQKQNHRHREKEKEKTLWLPKVEEEIHLEFEINRYKSLTQSREATRINCIALGTTINI